MLLARTLGRTVDELAATMSSREFSMWWNEYEREPWGEYRSDLRSAAERAMVANTAGKMLKTEVDVAELMFNFDRKSEPQTEIPPEQFFGKMN